MRLCTFLLALCLPTSALAQIDPQDELDFQAGATTVGSGARALGMGGAFLARADDATAASWNPAGLSYLRHPEISVVGIRTSFQTDRDEAGVLSSDRFLGYSPDLISVAYPFELGGATGAAQLSFQRTFSFFDGDRTIVRGANPPIVLSGSGGFDVLALGTGVQVSHKWRLGFTLNRWINGYSQTRERLYRRRTQQVVDFDLSGWNTNLGVIWTPIEALNIGLVGKTPFRGQVNLSRWRRDIESGSEGEPDVVTTNSYASDDVRLGFPGAVGFGLSLRPHSTLTVSADYTRTFWSKAKVYNYFVLPKEGEPTVPDHRFNELSYPTLGQDQVDTEQIRTGVEYVFIRGLVKWPLRVGYFSDRQYFQVTSGIPRFTGFTVGTGIIAGPFLLDVAYLHETGSYVDGEVNIDVRLHRFYASVIYRHSQ